MLCVHETEVARCIKERVTNEENLDVSHDENIGDVLGESNVVEDGASSEDETFSDPYVSVMPRSFFPCKSDEEALRKLMLTVMSGASKDSNGVCQGIFVGADSKAKCRYCGTVLTTTQTLERIQRRTCLHTLHHGTIGIDVVDLKYLNCFRLVPYDGASDVLFCSRKEHVITRELLDSWLWDVCGTGGTFRDAFSRGQRRTT